MKKFFLKLRELIEGPADPLNPSPISSKRIYFLACLVVAIVATFVGRDATTVGIWLASATAVAFSTAVSKT